MNKSQTLELAKELISKPSITPNDAGCQAILTQRLKKIGFEITSLPFGDVKNLWAKKGKSEPLFVFAGHTDVVPSGPTDQWTFGPFNPEVKNKILYGRGAADMKSSLAAMVIACEKFIQNYPQHKGSIAFLITSDEEGTAENGTQKVVEYLKQNNETINYCIVGEATCEKEFGDTLKIGRRGSAHGKLIIYGKQGHIAYPQLADNPIHLAAPLITELTQIVWDKGTDEFPPTTFQISNIHGGTGADNVIPGQIEIVFNLRYSPATSVEALQNKIIETLNKYKIKYDFAWKITAEPFLNPSKKLVDSLSQAINKVTKIKPQLSTSGGTSDARFISKLNCEIVEFGPCNASIHQIDEHVSVSDLDKLTDIYLNVMEMLLQ